MFEIDYFISLGRRDRILLVLADGTPQTSFPPQLTARFENGRWVPVEPLAANVLADDVPSILKKLNKEKLRILAPMLGVGYDDLKRRARRRKIRLILSVAAAVLAVAAGLGIFLGINHIRSEALRREAEEQARRAAEASAEAEEEKKRAEEEKKRAEEERLRAEEEKKRAEEEARKKEEERRNAVYNDLGERMGRASAALSESDKTAAASILLEALALSEENENMRRDEVTDLLRRALYIEPFSVIGGFRNQNLRINDIVVSPDGIHAIGVVNNNCVAMIDLAANEILYQIDAGGDLVTGLMFSDDGSRFLAQCDNARLVTVWNTEDGSEAFTYISKKNQQYHIANAFFWTDETVLLVQDMEHFYLVSENGTEKLFYTMGAQTEGYVLGNNLVSRITGRSLSDMFTIHIDEYLGTQVCLTKDRSRVLIVGIRGEAVIVLDGSGRRVSLFGVPADPTCFMPGCPFHNWALSPDGRTAVCLSLVGFIGGWDTETGELLILDPLTFESNGNFSDIVISEDSGRMAFTVEGHLYVCDVRTGVATLNAGIDQTSFTPSLDFSGDGRYLLMTNQHLYIIDTENWSLALFEYAEMGEQYNNTLALEDRFLITRYDGSALFYSSPALSSVRTVDSFDGELCGPAPTWVPGMTAELKSRHELSDAFLTAHPGVITAPKLVYSRDGKRVALLYPDGIIELFDTMGDGSVAATIGEFSAEVASLAMTETTLAASDQTGRFLLYDLETGRAVTILNAESSYTSLAIDPEGVYVMGLRYSGTQIDVYDAATAALLFSLHAPDGVFTEIGFSTDGAYAVAKTNAGRAVIGTMWTDEAELLAQARKLTQTE